MQHPELSRAYRVLVVEDEGLIALDISRRLQAQGHEVLGPASTAEEALALAPNAEIVLMDIRIDGQRDGIDTALEIRARHHLPVIFLTAHADRSTLERAKQAGPFGYIVKPLGPASLQTGIEMAIAKHRVERLLEEREAWLRAVLGSIADAAVVVSAEGRVRLLNRAAERHTGWTQAEAEGKPVEKVVGLTVPEGDFDPMPLALLRGEPVEFDRYAKLISRDGRELEVEGFAAPVRAGQELLGAVLTFRDASAGRWAERQLRQSQRLEAAGRLAAAAASEYSTLIGVIRKQNEWLLRQFGEFSAARGALEEIHRAAAAADEVTRRLEAFGTRQVGQPEALSVNGVLRRMAPLIEATTGDRIQAAIRPSPGAGKIKADAAQLEAAILSLVAHACRSMAAGLGNGQLLLDTARVDLPHSGYAASYVLLGVTYSAAEPEIERLFDPASTDGPSLALAQVHWLAAECGGYVSARSSPNGGSRIELLIPRLADQALLAGAVSQAGTILLIESSEAVLTELHNFFEAAGYNLIEAAGVEEAVALGEMHEGRLDLVIANARQAGEVLRHLSGLHPSLKGLCVVEDAQPAELAPDQIRRPFTERELLDKVEMLLGKATQQAASVAVPAMV
jgi:two-component system, cell cycle sensor histidine kinase and response regulator CckA